MNAAEFAHKWKQLHVSEKSGAHPWFYDLCAMLDVPTPTDSDDYMFEEGVQKLTGKSGYADVWMKGHFAWEFKSRGEDLDKAYGQLKNYAQSLENPPLLMVSDFENLIIRTNFTNTKTTTWHLTLDTIGEPDNLRVLRALWNDPASLWPEQTIEEVTAAAANELGAIALNLRDRGVDPHRAAHFTVELLFCFFAEDIALLPKGLFGRLLTMGEKEPEAFSRQLEELLAKMATGGYFGVNPIRRFNGGLFDELVVEPLTADEIKRLRLMAAMDWGKVEPAIFGTLFERSLDPARRAQLGAHYTGQPDIERVVEPVVMTPLRRRWAEVREEAKPIAETWAAARDGGNTRTANRQRNALQTLLEAFLIELRSVTILDPACGSGNFLYVALRKLMDLEKEVISFAGRAGLTQMIPEVSPRQVKGLEINEYAVEITQTVVWIGYLQWRISNGFGIGDPVLQPLDTIKLQDALLDLTDPENPKESEWPAADFIVGNPPFLGGNKVRRELGDSYLANLFAIFSSRMPKFSDLCCYFFEKARAQIENGNSQRAGLLATSSIRSGFNNEVLKRIVRTGGIFTAHSDEKWYLDGAAVRISIIAFDDGAEELRVLDGHCVTRINSNLTASIDVTSARKLSQNKGIGFEGPKKHGPFDVSNHVASKWLAQPDNPNGRPNSDVVKRFFNASDVVKRDRGLWIIDFGASMDEQEAAFYGEPFEYLKEFVKPIRDENRMQSRRTRWWIHGSPASRLREAINPLRRFLVTPAVSKYRIFSWLPKAVYPDHRLFVFAREDDLFFGIMHSRAHEVWSIAIGPRHGVGNDPVYTITTCFETFPFPWPPGEEPVDDPRVQAIAAAARELDEKRRVWLDPPDASEQELKKRTLTNLYNQRPTWLQHLHAALDRAVWDAYGWPADEIPAEVEEEVLLERLLGLNLERST